MGQGGLHVSWDFSLCFSCFWMLFNGFAGFFNHVYLTWLTVMKIHRRITIVNMWKRTGNVSCDVKLAKSYGNGDKLCNDGVMMMLLV